MSLTSHFMAQVASYGGLHTPGAPGNGVKNTGAYSAVMDRLNTRKMVASRLMGGQTFLGGQRLDGRATEGDAEFVARAMEWAEYFGQRHVFGSDYARLDAKERPKQAFADGRAMARFFSKQVGHGRDIEGKRRDGARLDAVVPMASQGLTFIEPEVYQYQHNDLPMWEEKVLKIYRGADPAAEQIAWYEMDNVGVAKVSNSYDTTTIPMVNGPLASDNLIKIVPAMVGMETNFMDMRRAAMAERMGKPDFMIEVMKRQACERALAEFYDNLWFGGDPELGIDGLMNNPAVEVLPISGVWSGKTALQIFDDLMTMAWRPYNRTGGALADFGKVRIILPPDQFRRLSLPITAAGSATILEYFNAYWKGNSGETKGAPSVELQARFAAANSYAYNGGPNILSEDTAVILYEEGSPMKDPRFVLTQPVEVPAPVRVTGVGEVTYFHARGGGLMLPDARRIYYVRGL